MSRHGKIAQLPEKLREQVNQRLADGRTAQSIVAWLNALPEVRSILAERFHGRSIRMGSLFQWRKGGYQDWLDHRDHLQQVRDLSRQACALAVANRASIAEGAAALASVRLFNSVREVCAHPDPVRLERLVQGLVAIRQIELSAARLRLDRQKLKLWRFELALGERRVEAIEKQAAQPALRPPGVPSGGGLSPETLALIRQEARLL